MTTERLTTLAAVKSWLDVDNTNSDAELTRIIDAASRFITNYLNWRSFKPTEYTYRFSGNGKSSMLLPNWPVISISSLAVGGVTTTASTFNKGVPSSGYVLDSRDRALATLNIYGNRFCGPGEIVYAAGFRYAETALLAVDDSAITVTPTEAGQWISNESVTIDGTAATLVTGAPAAGEYAVDEWGTYTFNVADDTKTAVITYGYAPWDIAFAATEIVGEWYKRRDRIGVLSKTLGGQETVTFSKMDMNDSARATLQDYMNVVPL